MSGAGGKRFAGHGPTPGPPPAKRGPATEFDDILEDADDMFNDDEVPDAYMPGGEDDGSGGAEPDLCEAGRNWLRPPPANLQPAVDALGAFFFSRLRWRGGVASVRCLCVQLALMSPPQQR